jgi:hypothetical protein
MSDTIRSFLQVNGLASSAFSPESRYYGVATTQFTQADGMVVSYVKRRFIPPPSSHALVQEHQVLAGDRLDNMAAAYIGDTSQYWRICDANGAMRPDDLTTTPGQRLRITQSAMTTGLGGTDAG